MAEPIYCDLCGGEGKVDIPYFAVLGSGRGMSNEKAMQKAGEIHHSETCQECEGEGIEYCTACTVNPATDDDNECDRCRASLHSVLPRLDFWRRWDNTKIVFTNGCFDILHAGHVKSLEQAKEYGDKLVVGLNSDSSVREIKGEDRPIIPETDRCTILQNLKPVDAVVVFDTPTPYDIIREIKPDVLVKGEDWKGKDIPGADLVQSVAFTDLFHGSTTDMIKKIREG